MHPFVKILIVVNLLFAVGFWAYTAAALETTTNYKQQHADEQTRAAAAEQALQDELSAARADLQQARDSRSAADQRANEEQARAERLERDFAAAQRENGELNDSFRQISNTLRDLDTTLASITEAKDRAVADQRSAEQAREQAIATQRSAEEAQRKAQQALASAEMRLGDLEGEIATATSTLSDRDAELATLVQVTGVNRSSIVSQPQIDGAVVAVNTQMDPGLVVLNRGEAHGVTVGTTFDIYAGNLYKGKVRVVNVLGDKASAQIVQKGSAPIAQGDRASTRL